MLGNEENAVDVDAKQALPVLEARPFDAADMADPGVVDKNVESIESGEGLLNRLGVGDIDGDHGNTLADLGGQLPGRFMIKIGNNDRRSRSRESADGLFADPAGAARHQSPAAIESKRLFHAVVGAMKPPLSPAQSWAAP